MSNQLRAALAQCLNSLEESEVSPEDHDFGPAFVAAKKRRKAALASARAALAQPEQPVEAHPCATTPVVYHGTWDGERQARPVERAPAPLNWVRNGDTHCGYDNWLAETPFGRILVSWKSWKEYPDASVDEFPGDYPLLESADPDELKAEAEAEFFRRVAAVYGITGDTK